MDRVYPVIDVEAMVDTIEEQESSKRARWWEADRLYDATTCGGCRVSIGMDRIYCKKCWAFRNPGHPI